MFGRKVCFVIALMFALVPLLRSEQVGEQVMSPADGFLIPEGDVALGKKAFLDLKCTRCHHVSNDVSLPRPIADNMAPTLGYEQASYLPGWNMNSIVTPSHFIKLDEYVPPSQTVRQGTGRWEDEHKESRMFDFTEIMTVKQLIDIVAYIQSLKDV